MKTSTVPTSGGCFKTIAVVPAVAALLLIGRRRKPRRRK